MPIDFRCPSGHKLSVDDSLAGRKARCPLCRQKLWVPPDNSQPNRFADAVEHDTEPTGVDVVATDAARGAAPPIDIYRPDAGKLQTVHLLALGMTLAALFAAAPAVRHWNLAAAPDWARLVLLVSALQLAYVAWMVSVPDWTSVWVAMLVYAVVTALYCAGMAIFLYTPADSPLVLDLEEYRYSAAGWCLAVVLLTGMMTFVAGRTSAGWRRNYVLALRRRQAAG